MPYSAKYLKLLLITFRNSMATCIVVDKMEEIVNLLLHVQSLLTLVFIY